MFLKIRSYRKKNEKESCHVRRDVKEINKGRNGTRMIDGDGDGGAGVGLCWWLLVLIAGTTKFFSLFLKLNRTNRSKIKRHF